jgi:hypothetical protein
MKQFRLKADQHFTSNVKLYLTVNVATATSLSAKYAVCATAVSIYFQTANCCHLLICKAGRISPNKRPSVYTLCRASSRGVSVLQLRTGLSASDFQVNTEQSGRLTPGLEQPILPSKSFSSFAVTLHLSERPSL